MEPLRPRVEALVRSVFGLKAAEPLEGVRYKEHPRWDSLGHIQLVLAVERAFGVRLTSTEIVSVRSVDDLAAALEARRAGGAGP